MFSFVSFHFWTQGYARFLITGYFYTLCSLMIFALNSEQNIVRRYICARFASVAKGNQEKMGRTGRARVSASFIGCFSTCA